MSGLEFSVRLLASRFGRWLVRRTADAPPPREWPIEILAQLLCEQTRKLRLERAGYEPPFGVGTPYSDLPEYDRQAWLDAAQAMVDLGWGPRPL